MILATSAAVNGKPWSATADEINVPLGCYRQQLRFVPQELVQRGELDLLEMLCAHTARPGPMEEQSDVSRELYPLLIGTSSTLSHLTY